jgi:membrane-associated phospholipid phosphatase
MPQSCPTYRRLLLPLLLAAAAIAALALDVPVGARARRWNDPAVLERDASAKSLHDNLGWFDTFEPFGHGRGIVLLLLALHQLDPKRRWAIPRLAACALAAGGIANLLKLVVARTRPNDLPPDFTGPVWATFHGWLPQFSIQSSLQSFPSAHTAAAAAFAAALIWLYPQGRLLFTLLAVLVGCQRIVSGAHFPSDVCAGAAAGCLAAALLLYVGRLPVWFDRWESRWRK